MSATPPSSRSEREERARQHARERQKLRVEEDLKQVLSVSAHSTEVELLVHATNPDARVREHFLIEASAFALTARVRDVLSHDPNPRVLSRFLERFDLSPEQRERAQFAWERAQDAKRARRSGPSEPWSPHTRAQARTPASGRPILRGK